MKCGQGFILLTTHNSFKEGNPHCSLNPECKCVCRWVHAVLSLFHTNPGTPFYFLVAQTDTTMHLDLTSAPSGPTWAVHKLGF
mmetsp:Transcript_151010/g.263889  ORF Transcript_151010/g.263889 Transcript_151010/m.263889 type:complete len:83 (-) Transcript_151010:3093-3341(-)